MIGSLWGKTKKVCEEKKKIILLIAAILVVAVLSVIAIKLGASSVFTYKNYTKEYKQAETYQDKFNVLYENAVAYCTADAVKRLNVREKISLEDASYYEGILGYEDMEIVLILRLTDNYQNTKDSYWLYNWNRDSKDWEYFGETYYDLHQSSSLFTTDLVDNVAKAEIEEILLRGKSIQTEKVTKITNMIENKTIKLVKLIGQDFWADKNN